MLGFHSDDFLAQPILDPVLLLRSIILGLAIGISLALENLKRCRELLVRLLKRFDPGQAILSCLPALVLYALGQLLVISLEVSDTLLPILVCLLFLDVSDSLQVVLFFFESALIVDFVGLKARFLVHQEPDLVFKEGPIFLELAVQVLVLFLEFLQLCFECTRLVLFYSQVGSCLLLDKRDLRC